MADDDEVDALDDFSLSNSVIVDNSNLISQNSELLNCDYTIHPQWLLDRPSTNPDNWYDENAGPRNQNNSDSDVVPASNENCITDESGWTEKEKALLQRGIEIFGRSSIRLAQFVGSKTAAEVKYYFKNFYAENLGAYQHVCADSVENIEPIPGRSSLDVLNSSQIPTSVEEVIASVSTAFPTVRQTTSTESSGNRQTSSSSSTTSSERIDRKEKYKKPAIRKRKVPKKKLKLKFNLKEPIFNKKKVSNLHKPGTELVEGVEIETESNVDATFLPDIDPKKTVVLPVCEGEEIVKIEHAEDDSTDMSIDIEDIDYTSSDEPKATIKKPEVSEESHEVPTNSSESTPEKELINRSQVSEEVAKQLDSMEVPSEEVVVNELEISDLEKYVHSEFFEGRPTKTPERYLKIRNYIIEVWHLSKPNYVFKTAVRSGLKQCGDVRAIGRIHHFLEQTGVINFGCDTKYERPLSKSLQFSTSLASASKRTRLDEPVKLGSRKRFKRKFDNDGEGGCTMVHGEKGEIIDTTIVNKEPAKPRSYIKKPSVRLIYCRPFSTEKPQEFTVKLDLSTLLLLDLHSHMFLTEVMGLVGGYWDPSEKNLKICCYEPCKNMASSLTHCDMCPISQAKAADRIHARNMRILGWFHSHPTFAPEPSQQDMDTQQFVQQWIGYGKPCIGVIMSPFSGNGALISSPFRCWMVDKKPNFEDQYVPYRFDVDVTTDNFNLTSFLGASEDIFYLAEVHENNKRLNFSSPYFMDRKITHLEKFLSSVNMHIAKAGTINRSSCDEITEAIKNLLK
ncbi:histone H2A deubiquitinase MYSM1-like isoform X2 [Anthonomus grandis grandis]|uniref:histone H2A deubiquitinase MYSM1-like isoform X2 n=1 Tax=Anthonomus grandis grandis TaxID=2921223 RepID=UPI0021665D0E|nr:histone H2A deubiquitinase MYSM1-like isoform X2 [Anthonomus grandis grandis]